uniref:sensor histidine kinase n=1 Tax=Agathobacter sp. TaxID=2021311 RepID=UPI0040565486
MMDSIALVLYLSLIRRICSKKLYTYSLYHLLKELWIDSRDIKSFGAVKKKNRERIMIREALEAISMGNVEVVLEESDFHGTEREMARAINRINEGMKDAVSSKMKTEKLKVDLITNVSHDIKTPLTSIVNYVELLRRENLDNENAKHYIQVIDKKAQRLKQLTEDLVEISKISSGNISLEIQEIDFVELLYQIGGEFNERFEQRNLTIVTKLPNESIIIKADGRQLYRAIENLYTNAAKYAFEDTNVYVDLAVKNSQAVFEMKNVYGKIVEVESGKYVDLTERFVRGESSRTTEGSGLGLSIAKSLIVFMGGNFYLKVENGLFRAIVEFPINDSA